MPFAVKTTRAGGVFILKPDTNRQSPVLSKTAEINKKNTHQMAGVFLLAPAA